MTVDQRAESAPETLPSLLLRNATERGGQPACREKRSGIWRSWTWSQMRDEVRALALGLQALGLAPGERMAVIGRNNPRLYWSLSAAQMLGAVPVPLFPDAAAEEAAFVLRHSDAAFAIAENQEQVDKLLALRSRLPELRHIVFVSARGMRSYDRDTLHAFDEVQATGRAADAAAAARLEAEAAGLPADGPCIIAYTAGTGGQPRGVVLSHRAAIDSARAAAEVDRLDAGDSTLSYLPLAWSGDFMVSVAQSHVCGFCIACPEGAGTVMADLQEIGPTYLLARPREFDGIRASATLRMADAGRVQRWLLARAMAVAARVGPDLLDRRPVPAGMRLAYGFWELLVYAPLRNALGLSRLRTAYAAGAPLAPESLRFFRGLGVNLKQLYGQTEAALFLAQHRDGAVRAGTVGEAVPGVELRLAADGTVEYRSPGALSEYYRDPEATAALRTADGWLRSGDAGRIAEGGQLAILDRAEDVGRLDDGTTFAPGAVENRLKADPHVHEAVVFGDGHPYCTAMLNIDFDAASSWADRHDIVATSYQELAGEPRVQALLQAHVEAVNRSLAEEPELAGCQIRRFLVLHKELDPDDGELTRTGRLRRKVVAARYAPLVEALYSGLATVRAETEVAYEDGRSGIVAATLAIHEAAIATPGGPAAARRQAA